MAPPRSRALPEDLANNNRERSATNSSGVLKARKNVNPGPSSTQSKENLVSSSHMSKTSSVNQLSRNTTDTWLSEHPAVLEAYRTAFRLDTSSSFNSPLNAAVLQMSGIGRRSPTMIRKKTERKVTKDQLALAVRKHFNSLAVNEVDVIVEFLYTVKSQDQKFKMRFAPHRQK